MKLFLAVFLGVAVAIALVVGIAVLIIRTKLRRLSKQYLGTTDLKRVITRGKQEMADNPKSISSLTRLMLPQIAEDFPEFNWQQMKERIDQKLEEKIQKDGGSSVLIHGTEIAGYNKSEGICKITAQSAVQFMHMATTDGSGARIQPGTKVQAKYNTELVYVQDMTKIGSDAKGIGLNCPNCGAPIKNLGAKFCEYCHTGIQEIDIRVWTIGSISEVK